MYKVLIVGATGIVGRNVLNILSEISFPVTQMIVCASNKSQGKPISFGHQTLTIQELNENIFKNVDIVFFCTNNLISKKYVPIALKYNCLVVDKSSYFRMNFDVPLIVPEINFDKCITDKNFHEGKRLIATPNCVAIPMSMLLHSLLKVGSIEKIVCTSLQSVSGAGFDAIDELHTQSKAYFTNSPIVHNIFNKQIAFNLLPQIGELNNEGVSCEEEKISQEIIKILGVDIKCDITCVRVPVFKGHSVSINCTFKHEVSYKDICKQLKSDDNLIIIDTNDLYATPIDAQGDDFVYVSRIRQSTNCKKTYQFWITCDNLRKGAALNGVQIVCKALGVKMEYEA